jgi:methyl-galactoside transport system ATP-binding protein
MEANSTSINVPQAQMSPVVTKPADSEYILQIKGLSKAFGKNQVLKNIDLNVRPATVMGLMGENGAGKSTMMKCLFGIYAKDEGTITLDGQMIDFTDPKEALEHGIAMVHQELNQCLERTVVDNLFLGRYITKFGIIDERAMLKRARQLFASLKMQVNPKAIVKTLSVSQRQMIEIAKAVSYNAKVIVLDEPTSSLSEREVSKLFSIVSDLRKQGISFIYISHKMDEIFQICDDVSVLRDGQMIMTKKVKDTNMNELIAAMVGRSLDKRFPDVDNKPGEEILEVHELSTAYAPFLKDISFTVKKGEIFGIYGLVGAGRSELLETIFGLRTISKGYISYKGRKMRFANAKDAMKYNFALITEERKVNGIFPKGSLVFNTTITNLDRYKQAAWLSDSKMETATKKEIKKMRTRCTSPENLISALSGGNQQKVIIGKWLERNPDIFLMDEPTRGIDVGAKYEIYELIIRMAKEGKTIIMVSSEMPEILGVTNRIAVMSNHRLAGIVNTKDTNQEELLRLSAKYL